ncbi:hypothetical protein M885DRAFT_534193 [Pelagophyceae sp. CCMP2097]|nr:hypothetical protein M885DRAFT_534193 [Pelagophyceae sp. CCMP2097]|mmetsp:Transcript_24206/g.83646  ORF Transcript_24206/g.83646 Transcript_24206/m.83646 type:complete len:236 (-) Transcript_24206:36-743(-)
MSSSGLTLPPPQPAAMQQRLDVAREATVLVELPFFSTMPDTGADQRFCDSRKSTFMRQFYSREVHASGRPPPQFDAGSTSPSSDFCFGDSLKPRGELHLARRGASGVVPHRCGPGAAAAPHLDNGIFASFTFDTSSSALTSKAYGRGLRGEGEHVPLQQRRARGTTTALDELMTATELYLKPQELSLEAISRAAEAQQDRTARRRAVNCITARHESSSTQFARCCHDQTRAARPE